MERAQRLSRSLLAPNSAVPGARQTTARQPASTARSVFCALSSTRVAPCHTHLLPKLRRRQRCCSGASPCLLPACPWAMSGPCGESCWHPAASCPLRQPRRLGRCRRPRAGAPRGSACSSSREVASSAPGVTSRRKERPSSCLAPGADHGKGRQDSSQSPYRSRHSVWHRCHKIVSRLD